jgi:hypothetical protein
MTEESKIRSNHTNDIAEPLAVSPTEAWRMMNVGNTRGYQILKSGELEFYHDGKSLKITTASIRARVARLLAAEATQNAKNPTERATAARLAKKGKAAGYGRGSA